MEAPTSTAGFRQGGLRLAIDHAAGLSPLAASRPAAVEVMAVAIDIQVGR